MVCASSGFREDGSTVNNAAFGSGNKVLHNIVGQLGGL